MNTNNLCSCCPPDSNQAFNDNIYSKAKVLNKTKIKTASRILKKKAKFQGSRDSLRRTSNDRH